MNEIQSDPKSLFEFYIIPEFLLEMGERTKKKKKTCLKKKVQKNENETKLSNEEREESDHLQWNRSLYQSRESAIPTLRTHRILPDKFTHLLNICPSISASGKMFKITVPSLSWRHTWRWLDAVFIPSGSWNKLHPRNVLQRCPFQTVEDD